MAMLKKKKKKVKGESKHFHCLCPENTVGIRIALEVVNGTLFLEDSFALRLVEWPVERVKN